VSATPDCLNPVLVGGTGRSGSTILGRLLGNHPDLFLTKPEEVRFIANEGGMATTLAIATSRWPKRRSTTREARLTVRRFGNIWFKRPGNSGLQNTITQEEMDELCARYLAGIRKDPLETTRQMTYDIMAKVTASAPGRRWVDGTPANARVTDLIEPIYPECQVIAIIRDGRDVAASFVEQTFGPSEIFEALDEWAKRSLRMHEAVQRCRSGRILTIDMLDMVKYRRQETLAEVCAFLNIPLDPGMVQWFEANVLEAKSHAGRWRDQFDADTTKRIDERYLKHVERLAAAGVRIPKES
jgi:hypothetical protein